MEKTVVRAWLTILGALQRDQAVNKEAQAVARSPAAREDDDETGVLIFSGMVPLGVLEGVHYLHCGEAIEAAADQVPDPAPPEVVIEYRHSATRTVHCVTALVGGTPVMLSEETATPCPRTGCSNNDLAPGQ